MKRQHKAERIQRILDEHFAEPPIPLRHEDPFTLLIAVLLSAQCTDARVNQVTPLLFARARTAAAMQHLRETTIRSIIRPCGLSPQKSKAIRALSRMIVAEHGGQVPRDLDALERLPGVGHKTASVVMAQAFGEPAFPVDTHIHRLAWRWGLSAGTSVEQTERDLVGAFPREHWNKLHLQLIHFGRAFCPARQHVPAACPICSWAMSSKRRNEEERQRSRRQPKADTKATHRPRNMTQR
jgi:endonuclease-3